MCLMYIIRINYLIKNLCKSVDAYISHQILLNLIILGTSRVVLATFLWVFLYQRAIALNLTPPLLKKALICSLNDALSRIISSLSCFLISPYLNGVILFIQKHFCSATNWMPEKKVYMSLDNTCVSLNHHVHSFTDFT